MDVTNQSIGPALAVVLAFGALYVVGGAIWMWGFERVSTKDKRVRARWSVLFFGLWTLIVASLFALLVLYSGVMPFTKLEPFVPKAMLIGVVLTIVGTLRAYFTASQDKREHHHQDT